MVGQPIKKQKTENGQPDLWGVIDEVEEKYADLIDDLEGETPHKPAHSKMKVTGMSIRQIPRIQETRRRAEKQKKEKK